MTHNEILKDSFVLTLALIAFIVIGATIMFAILYYLGWIAYGVFCIGVLWTTIYHAIKSRNDA